MKESPLANVFITLPTSVLVELYCSNPGDESKGRFWLPVNLMAVSRQVEVEVRHILDRVLIRVPVSTRSIQVSLKGHTAKVGCFCEVKAIRFLASCPLVCISRSSLSTMYPSPDQILYLLPFPFERLP